MCLRLPRYTASASRAIVQYSGTRKCTPMILCACDKGNKAGNGKAYLRRLLELPFYTGRSRPEFALLAPVAKGV